MNNNKTDYRIVLDVDGTICDKKKLTYPEAIPDFDVIKKIIEYKQKGFYIILYTSRQMRTYHNNVGKINANTLPPLINWLKKHDVPFDEIHVGKPWCGFKGFYVDDKSISPEEFKTLSYTEIVNKLGVE